MESEIDRVLGTTKGNKVECFLVHNDKSVPVRERQALLCLPDRIQKCFSARLESL